jgi:hypothetical protein
MDNEHCLIGFLIVVDDDFLNEDTREPLFGARVRARSVPSSRQIVSKGQQCVSINLGPPLDLSFEILNAALQLIHTFQSTIPTALQFARNQSLGWIYQLVTACRQGRFVTGCFQFLDQSDPDVTIDLLAPFRGNNGRLNSLP